MQCLRYFKEVFAWNAKLVIIYQLIVIIGHPLSYTLPIKTIRHSEKNSTWNGEIMNQAV